MKDFIKVVSYLYLVLLHIVSNAVLRQIFNHIYSSKVNKQ